jgi:hypothetical protein
MTDLLDVAIGLVLVFLLFSMLVSALQELLAGSLNWRGKMLEVGMHQLLDGAPPPREWRDLVRTSRHKKIAVDSLADAVLRHGLVDGLSRGDRLPSYLPPETVADALIDILRRRAGDRQPTAEALGWAIDRLPPRGPAEALRTMLDAAGGDATRLRTMLAAWYSDGMDRVTGWYTRFARYVMLSLGFTVALVFNVDAIYLAAAIQRDSTLRAALVAEAQRTAAPQSKPEDAKAAEAAADATLGKIRSLQLPIGWFPAPCNLLPESPQPHQQSTAAVQQQAAVQQAPPAAVQQPAQASQSGACTAVASNVHYSAYLPQLPLAFLGWILTAIAISQGAPFWFDLVQRLLSLRAAGTKPETEQPKAQGSVGTDQAAWAPSGAGGAATVPSPATMPPGIADAFESAFLSPDEVKLLQRRLATPETGEIDQSTRERIRSFQREHGRSVDGMLTPELARLILAGV